MKFLLDENAEFRIAVFLRQLGYNVTTVATDYGAGLADRDVLELARREGRILITNDKDFGELILRHQLPHAGIILFRLPPSSDVQEKIDKLRELITTQRTDLSNYLVVTARGVRIRSDR